MEAEHRQFLENLRSRTLIHPGHNPSQEELRQLEEAVEASDLICCCCSSWCITNLTTLLLLGII